MAIYSSNHIKINFEEVGKATLEIRIIYGESPKKKKSQRPVVSDLVFESHVSARSQLASLSGWPFYLTK